MRVKVHQFEGPLDMLLQLIEQEKLNITEISLAHVTEQFLAYIRAPNNLKPQDLADWLVVAAKLLVIKSRVLVPSLELSPEEQQDATDLAWQLYQYKCYKEVARHLKGVDAMQMQSFGREAVFAEKVSFYPDPAANIPALRDTMKYLAKTLEDIVSLPKKVLEEVVTITEKIEHLQRILSEKVEMKLRDLVANAKNKTEIIVTFLALLELVKQKILTVEQESIFADITIKKTNFTNN